MAYEADLEAWARKETIKAGGYLLKWVSPGNKGVPDRILLMPKYSAYLEFKNKTAQLEPLQETWRKRIIALDLPHYVVRTKADFLTILGFARAAFDEAR
jgi:hypothetical protein